MRSLESQQGPMTRSFQSIFCQCFEGSTLPCQCPALASQKNAVEFPSRSCQLSILRSFRSPRCDRYSDTAHFPAMFPLCQRALVDFPKDPDYVSFEILIRFWLETAVFLGFVLPGRMTARSRHRCGTTRRRTTLNATDSAFPRCKKEIVQDACKPPWLNEKSAMTAPIACVPDDACVLLRLQSC